MVRKAWLDKKLTWFVNLRLTQLGGGKSEILKWRSILRLLAMLLAEKLNSITVLCDLGYCVADIILNLT